MLNFRSSGTAIGDSSSKTNLTATALTERIDKFAQYIVSPAKSLIFCFCSNNISSVVCYLAALSSGQAIALFDAKLNADQKANLMETYRPEFVVDSNAEKFSGCSPVDDEYEARVTSLPDLTVLCLKSDQEPSIHAELALLLPTSGSTGSPKLVRLSYRNLEANARSICEALKISERDRPILNLPLHYSYGLSVLNSHLLAGASVTLTDENLLTERFWQIVKEHACSSFAGVPYAYDILDRLGLEQLSVPSLRKFTQAGGRLNSSLVAKFDKLIKARDGEFFVMYGQTEATARISVLPPDSLPEKVGSAGLAIPGGRLYVERDGLAIDSANAVGEIVYAGPNVMMGYANKRLDLGKGDELGGILHTGDLGYLDHEGFLYITGRSKRIAKVLGYRINLDEVEVLLAKFFPAAVVSDDKRIIGFCEGGDERAFAASKQFLAEKLHLHQSAFHFITLEEFPKNASGKIDYSRLLENVK